MFDRRANASPTALALSVCLFVGVASGAAALGVVPDAPPTAAVSTSVDAETETFTFVHRGGPTLSVSALALNVSVNGRPLRQQPPVPFFAARGFEPGPTGPFNVASDGRWERGERATFSLARTNGPPVRSGDRVTVRIVADGRLVASLSVRV